MCGKEFLLENYLMVFPFLVLDYSRSSTHIRCHVDILQNHFWNVNKKIWNPYTRICLDETIVRFTGRCFHRQYIRGKPDSTGLKYFILTKMKCISLIDPFCITLIIQEFTISSKILFLFYNLDINFVVINIMKVCLVLIFFMMQDTDLYFVLHKIVLLLYSLNWENNLFWGLNWKKVGYLVIMELFWSQQKNKQVKRTRKQNLFIF